LRLPCLLAITPEPDLGEHAQAWITQTQRSVLDAQRLTLVRAKQCSAAALTELLAPIALPQRARLLLHGDAARARALGCAGVHLSAAQARVCSNRPLPHAFLLGVSCHDADELAQATRVGADYVFLGPVRATASHPQVSPLGWARFSELARTSAVPVFALGGVGPADLVEARAHGAFGVAGISAFWPAAS
jgi:8-oxo-dGTP diphosphatase